MPKLIVKHKAEVIEELNLSTSQPIYTIGADDSNDLIILDKLISGTHARIERNGNRYFLRDMKSAFGTYVNNQRIEKNIELKNSDEIRIGDHIIAFDNPLEYLDKAFLGDSQEIETESIEMEGPSVAAEALSTKQEEFSVEQLEKEIAIAHEEDTKETAVEMAPFYLLAIYGPYRGKKYQLKYGETRIGRDSKLNDIIIRKNKKGEIDPSISRRHATIIFQEDHFTVIDKRSKTRSYVNQEMVPEDGDIELKPGDELEIVSDQQSSILRFVSEGEWNFSGPKKAGVWWIRYRTKFLVTAAIAGILGGGALAALGFMNYSVIDQKPDNLQVESMRWRSLSTPGRSSESLFQQSFGMETNTPALHDFNGDGFVDIATLNSAFNPILLDGKNKRTKWTVSTFQADPSMPIVTTDLNNNNLDDVLFVSNNGQIVAVDGKIGAEIWTSPYFNGPFTGQPIAGDFNGDGSKDIAICESSGKLRIGYNQISAIDWVEVDLGLDITSPLSAADLDLDGDYEIICGTSRGLVAIIDGRELKIRGAVDMNDLLNKARGSFYEENQITFPAGVSDLNGDGQPDIVISSIQGNLLAVDGASRVRLWEDRLTNELSLTTDFKFPFIITDVSADGIADVVVATSEGEIRAYRGTGDSQNSDMLWTHSIRNAIVGELSAGDINKDAHTDIIFLDEAGLLHVINGRDGSILWKSQDAIKEATSTPFVADMQNDSFVDIILVTSGARVMQYKTNSQVPAGSILWGQQYGSSQSIMQSGFKMPSLMPSIVLFATGVVLLVGGFLMIFTVKRH